MRLLILIIFIGFSFNGFGVTEEECKKHVAENIDVFSICWNSGITRYNGREIVNFDIKACKKKENNQGWECVVDQDPWPSSGCSMSILLDQDCYRNTGALMLYDGREDL